MGSMKDAEVVYSKKILVFYDLLGFKNLIERREGNPHIVNQILKEFFFISKQEHFTFNYQQINFSDTIIQIFDPEKCLDIYEDNLSQFIDRILDAINRVHNHLLLKHNLAIRGAIVYGDLYYNEGENIIFGPALNTAATLEKKAKYPRIIIDESISNQLEIKEEIETTFLNYTVDKDGKYYANPFHYIAKTKYEQKKGDIQIIKQNLLDMIKEVESWEANTEEKNKVLEKFHWLLVRLIERELLDMNHAKELLSNRK